MAIGRRNDPSPFFYAYAYALRRSRSRNLMQRINKTHGHQQINVLMFRLNHRQRLPIEGQIQHIVFVFGRNPGPAKVYD